MRGPRHRSSYGPPELLYYDMNSQDRWPGRTHLAGSFDPRRGVSLLYPVSDFPGSANAETMHLFVGSRTAAERLGGPRNSSRMEKQAPFIVHEDVGTQGRPERKSR